MLECHAQSPMVVGSEMNEFLKQNRSTDCNCWIRVGKILSLLADIGDQCNVVPLSLHKKATTDFHLKQKICSAITEYGGTKLPVMRRTSLKTTHILVGLQNSRQCKLFV